MVIATALRLTGDIEIRPSAEVAALVEKEVEKVTAARVTEKPAWLGPPDEGFLALDYSRFKPRVLRQAAAHATVLSGRELAPGDPVPDGP